MHDERIAASLASAERFAAYSPVLREEVLSALLSGKQHLPGLIVAIESGAVSTGAIDSLAAANSPSMTIRHFVQRAERTSAPLRGRIAKRCTTITNPCSHWLPIPPTAVLYSRSIVPIAID